MSTASLPYRPVRPNRRNELRFVVALPVTLLSRRRRVELVTWDVSFRGLYVETTDPEPPRRLVRLSVVRPTGAPVVFHGMVVNVVEPRAGERRPHGMGIELFAVDPQTRGEWWELVRFVRDHLLDLDSPSGVRPGPSPIP